MPSAEDIIRRYYQDFNARRLKDAARLFAPTATVEHLPGITAAKGCEGYLQFACAWLTAFPDAQFEIERISASTPRLHEVSLKVTGTHSGTLEYGTKVFRATGNRAALRARELIEVEEDHFVWASLSVDLQELVRQLTNIDVGRLEQHLHRLERLHRELTGSADHARERELLDAIGRELDAARQVVRPYFR